MRKPNAWYAAICSHLREARGPLVVDQIWSRMEASGFQHKSEMPRSTLGARIAELVQMKRLERIAPKTYRLLDAQEEVAS